jgi:YD repeat-containing protein
VHEQTAYLYTMVPVLTYSASEWWGTPEIGQRTITRDGQTFVTTFAYDMNVNQPPERIGQYHRPLTIVETGTAGTRTTQMTYDHSSAWILGLLATHTVSAGGQTFSRSWGNNLSTGFRQTESVAGKVTTFVPDSLGNVITVTKPNQTSTSFTYEWGRVKSTTTEEGVQITREIDVDGTVRSETTAARTATYEYDILGRLSVVRPPTGNVTVTTYAADSVVVGRGA